MYNKSLKVIPFPDIEKAYIVISSRPTEDPDHGNGVEKCMSFLFDGGNGVAVEWEPNYGPITIIRECNETDEGAVPHWFFPFYKGQSDWTQLGVHRSMLPEYFIEGNYTSMFNAMKSWLEGRSKND